MPEFVVRVRRYLITGLVVIAPVFVTVAVLLWLFRMLDDILGRYVRTWTGTDLPGLGVVALVLVLLLIGWISQKAAGRRLLAWWNSILSRFPLTRTIYNASSQIVQSVLDRDEKLFRSVALIEYPMEGSYSLVFVTAAAPRDIERRTGEPSVSCFLPTAPNPATGYLLVLPASRVHVLDMTVEEGIKMVVSAGVTVPGGRTGRGLDLRRLHRRPPAPPGTVPAAGAEPAPGPPDGARGGGGGPGSGEPAGGGEPDGPGPESGEDGHGG